MISGTAHDLIEILKKSDAAKDVSDITITSGNQNDIKIFFDLLKEKGFLTLVTRLAIFDCRLITIPNMVFEMQNLTSLCISGTKLQYISPSIEQLQRLEDLSFSQNAITVLPLSICNLKGLKNLQLSGNALSELPFLFTQLQSLEFVDISSNKFEKFPACLLQLTGLKYLNIVQNSWRLSQEEMDIIFSLSARCDVVFNNIFPREKLQELQLLEKRFRPQTIMFYAIPVRRSTSTDSSSLKPSVKETHQPISAPALSPALVPC